MIYLSGIKDCSDNVCMEDFCDYPEKVLASNSKSKLGIDLQAVKPLINEIESSRINTNFRISLGKIERMSKYTRGVHCS